MSDKPARKELVDEFLKRYPDSKEQAEKMNTAQLRAIHHYHRRKEAMEAENNE